MTDTTATRPTVTVNGKDYIVYTPSAFVSRDGVGIVSCHYRSIRNGKGFGPARFASDTAKPGTVGAKLVAAAQEFFNADYAAMKAEAQRVTAEKLAQYQAEGRTSYSWPSVDLITRSA